ncbi:MAG: hypothetical protein R2852_06085 [Bacteroidia bacterium]
MEKFENNQIKMEIIDGVLFATYKAGLKLTLTDVKNIVNERLVLLKGKQLPVLIIDSGVISMDKSARDYLSSEEGISGLKSAAIIENSIFSKMLINFFLRLTNPKIQVKAFGNQEEALTWLKSQN